MNTEDRIMTSAELAQLIRVDVSTLGYWRRIGEGPTYFKVGRWARYRLSDVKAWFT